LTRTQACGDATPARHISLSPSSRFISYQIANAVLIGTVRALPRAAEGGERMPEEKIEEGAKPETKAGGLPKLILIVGVAVVSSLGGGIVSWVLTTRALSPVTRAATPDEPAATETSGQDPLREALEKGGAIALDPFVVNLADADTARYLRIKVNLMLDDKTKMSEIQNNQALQVTLRDLILQTLTQKTSQDLNNEEGKNKLRHEIQAKIEGYFKKPKLVDVMFTDFVIQL